MVISGLLPLFSAASESEIFPVFLPAIPPIIRRSFPDTLISLTLTSPFKIQFSISPRFSPAIPPMASIPLTVMIAPAVPSHTVHLFITPLFLAAIPPAIPPGASTLPLFWQFSTLLVPPIISGTIPPAIPRADVTFPMFRHPVTLAFSFSTPPIPPAANAALISA